MYNRLKKDWTFGAALLAAPLFDITFFVYHQPPLDILWPLYAPLQFLSLSIFYPIAEEITFRGLLQAAISRLIKRQIWGPISFSNLLTSFIFSGSHLLYHSPIWSLMVIFPSLIFGFFKERYQDLKPPIILHIFYNISYFWFFRP